ncbi:MAG: hypothetical protein GWM98_01610 [Nitrospinaceae bacterium]|nr:hypothetical protein [Nitrospinaceae bacterium]NIS83845.1 hypothetical protein [Nitrospinaceae bacterium]NIT80636.1 hypothetical protein [Nitrospinaceae bacterium]NIU95041.1 hypothetical protein [Nitrospinaceae bacterium]NIY13660.1 hypothetical protein [Nitrospinaceae bacterium]
MEIQSLGNIRSLTHPAAERPDPEEGSARSTGSDSTGAPPSLSGDSEESLIPPPAPSGKLPTEEGTAGHVPEQTRGGTVNFSI